MMSIKHIGLGLALSLISIAGFSQQMSINTDGALPDSSAMLDVKSTEQGILIPRMTAAQKVAITDPADGLIIYQTDGSKGIHTYDLASTTWKYLLDSAGVAALINSSVHWSNASPGIKTDSAVGIGGVPNPVHALTIHSDSLSKFGILQWGDPGFYNTIGFRTGGGSVDKRTSFGLEPDTGSLDNNFSIGTYPGGATGWTNPLRIELGAPTNTLFVDSSGNVGFNTTSLSNKLTIYDPTNSSLLLTTSEDLVPTNSINSGSISLMETNSAFDATGGFGFQLGYDGAANKLRFRANNGTSVDTAVTILRGNGFVGIGTDSPLSPVHITGIYSQIQLTDEDDSISLFMSAPNPTGGATGGIGTSDSIGFPFFTNGADQMWIGADGNIGIGTTTPLQKLDVAGTATVDALNINSVFTLPTTDGTNGQVMQTDGSGNVSWGTAGSSSPWTTSGSNISRTTGNVAIGSTLVVDKFQVISTNSTYGYYSSGYFKTTGTIAGENRGIIATSDGVNTGLNVGVHASAQNATTNRAIYASSGDVIVNDRVGINTLTPAQELDVVGQANIDTLEINSAFTFPSTDGTNGQVMQSDGSGNVTWETPSTSPTDEIADADNDTKIQVEETGDEDVIRFDMAGTEYFTMDSGRLAVVNTGGSVIIGEGAGINDDFTSNYNSIIGHNAGGATTTGYQNVFLGSFAGRDNNTGFRNVLLGYQSGLLQTTGYQNVAIGYRAGYTLSSGNSNVMIGYQAGRLTTSGIWNTFSGGNAGEYNTTGNHNVFTGFETGRFNSTGSYSTMIGFNAGRASNGDYNTFVGYQASYSNGTGVGNVSLGRSANTNNSGGSYNVAIGYEAGAGSVTHSKNNGVYIGYRAGYSDTTDQKLYIENSNSTTPLIYGDFANDSLKVYGNLSIGDEFSFPSTDGTNGQILETDGAGNVTWSSLDTFSIIQDADGNTSVDAEQSSNDNTIRFTTNGTQAAEISSTQHMALGAPADASSNLYVLNIANTASTYGPGKAAILGYRTGGNTAANGGTGWTPTTSDVGVKGYSYWGNNYTAGVAGYNYGDYALSTGVIGFMVSGSIWGALGYNDGTNKWGVYSANNAYLGSLNINDEFTLPTADGTSGQVMQTDGSGNVSWQTPAGGADGDWDTTTTTLSTLKDVSIGGTTNYANSKLQLNGGGIVAWGTTGSLLDASGNNHGHDEDVALTIDGKSGEDILRLRHANTTNLVVVNNLGNIGIGTSTPAQELDVVGTTTVDTLNINDNFTLPSVDGTSGQVMVTDGSGNMTWGVASGDNLGDHTATQTINLAGNFLSGDGDAEGIHVDANGDVTVGASYGYSKFAVWDSNDVDFDIRSITGKSEFEMGSYGTSSAGNTVNFYRARGEFLSSSGVNYFDRIVEFNSSIYNGSSTFSMPFLTVRAVGTSGNVPTQIEFSTVDGSGNSDERLVIQSNGNVAIGQSYSNYPLHISSSSTNTTFGITDADNGGNLSHSMYMNTDNNAIYQMKDSAANLNVYLNTGGTSWLKGGNVGIGKSSAAYPLDVEGETRIDGTLGLYNFAEWDHIKFSHTGSLAYMDVGGTSDGLAFRTENTAVDYTPTYTEHMRILNNGNVGIGTSSPNKSLDIEGTFGFSGISYIPNVGTEFDLDVSNNSHFDRNNVIPTVLAPRLRRIIGGELGQIITITFSVDGADLQIINDASTGTGDPILIDGLAQDAIQGHSGFGALILVKGPTGWLIVN
jgi:hypothetical protein